MSSRFDDRDFYRSSRDYGRRSESDYGRGYNERSDRPFGYAGARESERYTRELGEDRSRFGEGTGREYEGGREGYWGRGWENERDDRSRYGNPIGGSGRNWEKERDDRSRYGNPIGGSGFERGYYESSPRYNYPSGYRSGERYGERGYDDDRERYNRGEGRGWWDRASDEVASWFGDEEAERRRRMDELREHRGRGPKGYRRSDERIREDVNDRLGDDYYLDASDIEVAVENTEVTLTGTVRTRNDKRRAEDIADAVSGVTNVENRLRVKQSTYASTGTGTGTGTSIEGTPGTTTSSAAAGGGTRRS